MKERLEDILSRGDSGTLMNDANEALEEVVRGVLENGGKGEVTLKIKIASTKHEYVEIVPELNKKVPQPARRSDLYFGNIENGDISRNSPSQPDLPNTRDQNTQAPEHEEPERGEVDSDGVIHTFTPKA